MAPAGSIDARLLILGSLPGDASLKAQQYYAHPRNQFWRLVGAALGEDIADLDYPKRLERLAVRGVALWDVVEMAMRQGSLDGSIRNALSNPLREFVTRHPRLEAIAFNGQAAARLGRLALADVEGPLLIDLPSSSPAYTLPFAWKAERWAELGRFASR